MGMFLLGVWLRYDVVIGFLKLGVICNFILLLILIILGLVFYVCGKN